MSLVRCHLPHLVSSNIESDLNEIGVPFYEMLLSNFFELNLKLNKGGEDYLPSKMGVAVGSGSVLKLLFPER